MHEYRWLALILTYLVALNVGQVVWGMVAGVDFGGEFFKVALVKPGSPFEIVTNVHSKRKTEVVVAFDGEERKYGADATSVSLRRPNTAYKQIRRLLGRTADHPHIQAITANEYYPYELFQNATRRSVDLRHQGETSFSPEELVAMVFSHAREITDSYAGGKVHDWVVTVPSFFTQAQRIAIIDAAELAGIKVLSLIDENASAALQFGRDRTFEDKAHRVLFYNMGSTSTQVSVVEYDTYLMQTGFKKNKTVGALKTLGKAWDETLGGHQFDLRLAEHFADQFNSNFGAKDIRQIPRAMAKIKEKANKVKKVLSTNSNIPVTIQSLHNGIDFRTEISRAEFENMCTELFGRVVSPIDKAIAAAGVKKSEIDAIELIGGGVRVPKVRQIVTSYFEGHNVGMHLNGDEAMAMGAAFRAANLSAQFRVRSVGFEDASPFTVAVRLVDLHTDDKNTEQHWVKRAILFPKNALVGTKRRISFTYSKDIACTIRYDNIDELPTGSASHIASLELTGIAALAEKMKADGIEGEPTVVLSFMLDTSSIVKMVNAVAKYDVELPSEPEPEESPAKEAEGETKPRDKEEPEATDESDMSEKKEDLAANQSESTAAESTEKSDHENIQEEKKPKITMPKKPKRKVVREQLQLRHTDTIGDPGMTIIPMTITDKKNSIALLHEMDRKDALRAEREEAKNSLESYLYSTRAALDGGNEKRDSVTVPEQIEEIRREVDESEEWLYSQGETAELVDYQSRKSAIMSKVEAIQFRMKEYTARPEAVSNLRALILDIREKMPVWEAERPQVLETERQNLLDKASEMEKWVEEKLAAQEQKKLEEEPAFSSDETLAMMKGVQHMLLMLETRPMPKPVEVPVDKEKQEGVGGNKTEDGEVGKEGVEKQDGEDNAENVERPGESVDEGNETSDGPEVRKPKEDL